MAKRLDYNPFGPSGAKALVDLKIAISSMKASNRMAISFCNMSHAAIRRQSEAHRTALQRDTHISKELLS